MNRAIINITHDLLGELLQLPEGHRIVRVIQEFDDEQRHQFKIVVDGPLMPEVFEGEMMRIIMPSVEAESHEVVFGNCRMQIIADRIKYAAN